MINFDSLAAVRISADIIATNYSSLWMYLGGGHGVCLFKTPAYNHFWAICLFVPASISHYTTTVQYIL